MKAILLKLRWPFLGAILGGIAGYLYWQFYGCENGCTITGSPVNSTLYMAMMGALIPGLFSPTDRKNAHKTT
jgi:hypothetical protein